MQERIFEQYAYTLDCLAEEPETDDPEARSRLLKACANGMRDALKMVGAMRGLLKYHQEGDDGADLPREYWSPEYREAVEQAEALVGSNVEFSGAAPLHGAASAGTQGYASRHKEKT